MKNINKKFLLIIITVLIAAIFTLTACGNSQGINIFQSQKTVCPSCNGSGQQQLYEGNDMNGMPIYNWVVCSGCGGSGYIN